MVGHHREWVKYHHRGDCEHLWAWLLGSEVKALCAVAAVLNKSGAQRKILAVVPKNTRWRRPDRERDLGLYGGDALSDVVMPEGVFAATKDLENAFTYVQWPRWVWAYQCGPPLKLREAPSWVRQLYAGRSRETLIYPAYKTLAMGDTHAVDILLGIVLARRTAREIRGDLPGEVTSFLLWNGWDDTKRNAWEIFSGEGVLTQKLVDTGEWNLMRPVDVIFGEAHNVLGAAHAVILAVLAGCWVHLLHLGPPCSTFSIAVSPPRRSEAWPFGLPGLPADVQALLDTGTKLMLRALHYFRLQMRVGMTAVLEQPLRSQAFFLPAFKALVSLPGVGKLALDYCRFGKRWKKPTALVYTTDRFPALEQIALHCQCTCAHQELRGGVRIPTGWRRWTSIAAPYPEQMCALYARLATEHVGGEKIESPASSRTSLNLRLSPQERLVTGSAALDYTHVDDTLVLAATAEVARRHITGLAEEVTAKGFVVGDITEPGSVEPFIGFRIAQSGLIATPRDRLQAIFLAIHQMISLPKVMVGGRLQPCRSHNLGVIVASAFVVGALGDLQLHPATTAYCQAALAVRAEGAHILCQAPSSRTRAYRLESPPSRFRAGRSGC
ncbi:hypothetical protein N9L68_01730 [bacterium]|nr:hypothetical protein [bacterium]